MLFAQKHKNELYIFQCRLTNGSLLVDVDLFLPNEPFEMGTPI